MTAVAGQAVPLASFGALALKLNCVNKGGGDIAAEINATSTVANSDGYGTAMTTAGSSYNVLTIGTNSSFEEANDQAANFFTPTGQTYLADLTLGENYLGATCYANPA